MSYGSNTFSWGMCIPLCEIFIYYIIDRMKMRYPGGPGAVLNVIQNLYARVDFVRLYG